MKRNIIICPGPEYLFWSSGVYYCVELSKKYNIILVADQFFKNYFKIEKLKCAGVIKEYYPYPLIRPRVFGLNKLIYRHLHFSKLSKSLLSKEIILIIQHTDLEAANIYLYKEGTLLGIPGIMYRATTIPEKYYQDYKFIKNWIISTQKIAVISLNIANYVYNLNFFFRYLINYFFIPFILTGNIFKPRIKIFPSELKYFNSNKPYYSWAIIHTEIEADIVKKNGEPSVLVENPISTSLTTVAKILGWESHNDEEKNILLLPTSGEYDWYLSGNKFGGEGYIQAWIEVLRELRDRFPAHKLILKCHPMANDFNIYKNILAESGFKQIEIIENSYPVEELILKSEIIIGTTTSALWWASQIESKKLIISLDLFGLNGGDRYRERLGIIYINNIEIIPNLSEFFGKITRDRYMSLTDFIEKIL